MTSKSKPQSSACAAYCTSSLGPDCSVIRVYPKRVMVVLSWSVGVMGLGEQRLPVEVAELGERAHDVRRAGFFELLAGEPTGEYADAAQADALGRLDVVGGVTDQNRAARLQAVEGGGEDVGRGLGLLGVVGAGQRVDALSHAEHVDRLVGEVALSRRREADLVPGIGQQVHQVRCLGQSWHLVDELGVLRLPAVADVVPELLLDAVAGDVRHQPVAAHPDCTVDLEDGHGHVVCPERAEPRDRVVVGGVDERPVDVEEDHAARHYGYLPPRAELETAQACGWWRARRRQYSNPKMPRPTPAAHV